MTRRILLALAALCAGAATAQIRRSSRNLEPLTKKPGAAQASTRSGDTGLGVAARPDAAEANTVTRITFVGPTRGWGYLRRQAPYYAPDGRRLGELPGGTLFTYSDLRSSSRNTVLVSRVKRGEAWEGPVLLDCTDIAAYEGSPDTVDPQLVADLGRYFKLAGQVAARRAELEARALAANPHYASAREAQQAYQDSLARAAEMEAQMNALSGTRKTRALDALRAYKYEQVKIKAKADEEAAAYKRWKEAHPLDPAALAADPELRRLERDLAAAREPVRALLPADDA